MVRPARRPASGGRQPAEPAARRSARTCRASAGDAWQRPTGAVVSTRRVGPTPIGRAASPTRCQKSVEPGLRAVDVVPLPRAAPSYRSPRQLERDVAPHLGHRRAIANPARSSPAATSGLACGQNQLSTTPPAGEAPEQRPHRLAGAAAERRVAGAVLGQHPRGQRVGHGTP